MDDAIANPVWAPPREGSGKASLAEIKASLKAELLRELRAELPKGGTPELDDTDAPLDACSTESTVSGNAKVVRFEVAAMNDAPSNLQCVRLFACMCQCHRTAQHAHLRVA